MNLRSKLNRFQLNHIGLLSFVMCFCCQLTALEYKEQRSQKVLLSEGFETSLNQGVGRDILANRWIELSSSNAASGSAALKVLYKGDARGSKRVIVNSPFARSERAKLSFSVRFCPGFDFAKGGKMHGLGPAKPAAGGKKGGPEQWSARLMWRKNGGLMTYVYHQDMKKKYGETRIAKGFKFNVDQYYRIEMLVQLNSEPTIADGFIDVEVDGKHLIHHSNIKFNASNHSKGLIQTMMFNTFFGGSQPDWAPRYPDGRLKTDCAYFDDFQVTSV